MEQRRHQCLVYKGDPVNQLPALAAVLKQKLREDYRCLYLNSPSMVEGLRSHLSSLGVAVANDITKGHLVLSSEPVVSADGVFDADSMLKKLEGAVTQALRDGYKGLFATGDMTWELGPLKDNYSLLVDYEWKLERLFRRQYALSGICQYHVDTLPIGAMRQALRSHPAIFVNETLSRINQYFTDALDLIRQAARDRALDNAIVDLCQVQDNQSQKKKPE